MLQATRDLKAELLNGASAKDIPKLLELHDLLQQMLVLDPAKRIKVDQALKHPFVTHSSSNAASTSTSSASSSKK